MKAQIWGCEVAWPGFMPFTRTVAFGVAIWAGMVYLGLAGKTRIEAAEGLIWIVPMVCSQCGLNLSKGVRGFALSMLVLFFVLGLFEIAVSAWQAIAPLIASFFAAGT